MRNKLGLKLSTKIISTFVFATVAVFSFVAYSVDQVIKINSYEAEKEKAQLLLDGISSEVSMNLYLGLKFDAVEKTKLLFRHSPVLSVKLSDENGKMIGENFAKNLDKTKLESAIKTHIDIKDSVTGTKMAQIDMSYSNDNYLKLIDSFRNTALQIVAISLLVLLVILGFIEYLLIPLGEIADKMRSYRPGKKIDFDIIEHQNEIGLIVSAFKNMQENINSYHEQLNNINQNLEQKVEEKTAELSHAYYYDALTKLPNRNKLQETMKHGKNVLAILNIDDFKEVNDFYGFAAGDEILAGVGGWLSACGYDAYRLSGDEFAILFPVDMDKNWLMEHIDRLHEEMKTTFFSHGDESVQLNATLGVCLEDTDALSKADIALHLAKHNKEPIGVYSSDHNIEAKYEQNIIMASNIKSALENDRVLAYFQPIQDTTTGKITKFETLIRIKDSNGNIIPPNDFLPIAKKGRYYPELTKRIVSAACEQFKNRSEKFSINISAADILSQATVEFIINKIKETDTGEKIIFELLESEGIEELAEVSKFISEVKKLGAQIAVDDFGTGYSNFEHILKLQVDYLKIDGSLIKNINSNREAKIIVETIVEFAKKLGISVVAEYVSSEDIYTTVANLGIESAQGFFIGKPTPLSYFHSENL